MWTILNDVYSIPHSPSEVWNASLHNPVPRYPKTSSPKGTKIPIQIPAPTHLPTKAYSKKSPWG